MLRQSFTIECRMYAFEHMNAKFLTVSWSSGRGMTRGIALAAAADESYAAGSRRNADTDESLPEVYRIRCEGRLVWILSGTRSSVISKPATVSPLRSLIRLIIRASRPETTCCRLKSPVCEAGSKSAKKSTFSPGW